MYITCLKVHIIETFYPQVSRQVSFVFIIFITATVDDFETPEVCKTIRNGEITDNGFSVKCDPGYSISDDLYTKYSCQCNHIEKTFTCVGKPPKCQPGK